MRGKRLVKVGVLVFVLAVLMTAPMVTTGAAEYGVGSNVSTFFDFASFGFGLDAYARFLVGSLAWELAFGTSLSFSSLHIQNTIATLGALYFCLGHSTYLLPFGSFGSTYFFGGLGWAFGNAVLVRLAANLALSVSGYGVVPFLVFRFQLGFGA